MPPSASVQPVSAGHLPRYAPGALSNTTSHHDRHPARKSIRHAQSFDLLVEHGRQRGSLLHLSDCPDQTLHSSDRPRLDRYRRPHRLAKGLALSESQLDYHDDRDSAHVREAPSIETAPEPHSIRTTASFNPFSYQHKDGSERHTGAETSSRVRSTYELYQPIEHEPWTHSWSFSPQANRIPLAEAPWAHWVSPEQMAE